MVFHEGTVAAFLKRKEQLREAAEGGFAAGREAVETQLQVINPNFLIPELNPQKAAVRIIETGILAKESGMGFIDGLLKTVVSVGRGLLGLPAKAARVVRAAPKAAVGVGAAVAAGGVTAAALAAGGGAPAGALPGFVVNPATGELVAPGGGNGVLATTTMVTTVNRLTGQIVKQRVFVGSPFIMNKEVAHLKSVIKKIGRADRKIPRRTSAMSLNAQINAAIKDSILHQAQRGAARALGSDHKDG